MGRFSVNILVCAEQSDSNDYIRLLSRAYAAAGHGVSLSPRALLEAHAEPAGVPDVVHLHWPEQFYKTNRYLPMSEGTLELLRARLEYYKQRGSVVVYTVHNLAPHESADKVFESAIYRLFAESADILLHHGSASVKLLQGQYGDLANRQHVVVPHGAYDTGAVPPERPRAVYGLPASGCVLLNFGLQRRYKGPAFIARTLRRTGDASVHLFTIGPLSPRPTTAPGKAWRGALLLCNALTRWPRARFARHTRVWREVPASEIPAIMSAADIVFLGHASGLNSGLLALAASYAKPVVFPDVGNFSEQLDGWPWAESYVAGDSGSALSALSALRARLRDAEAAAMATDHREWLQKHDWQVHVSRMTRAVDAFAMTGGASVAG